MSRKLTGLTFEEHQQLGAELKALHNRLNEIVMQLGNAYGVASKATRRADKMQAYLHQLRSELDSQLFKECRDHANTHVYYGEIYNG